MFREPMRWQTPLGEWAQEVGVRSVAEQCEVTPNAVYKWIAGSYTPRPLAALRIVELSEGRVSLMDVFAQRVQIELLRREPCVNGSKSGHSGA